MKQNDYMTEARWTAAFLIVSVVGVLTLYHTGTDPDSLAIWVLRIGAPATSLFVFLYGFTVRWWEFWIGRALMVSSTGMALLCDVALLNRVYPKGYPLQEDVVLTLLCFISMGGFLKLTALLVDKVPLWLGWRGRHGSRDEDAMR